MEKDILIRFIKCETSPAEEARIAVWLDASPDNQKQLDFLQMVFDSSALLDEEAIGKGAHKITAKPARKHITVLRHAARIAAIFAVGVVMTYFMINGRYEQAASQPHMIEVPAGQRISLSLNDGSGIWLNSDTRFEYPGVFTGKERVVRLEGEAMFDVEHDPRFPFVVETYACRLEVLGTKFNVIADREKEFFSAALMEGSLKVSNYMHNEDIVLKPNQMVSLVGGRLLLSDIANPDEYLWTEGILSINGVAFDQLMARFEKYYGVTIKIDRSALPKINYAGGKLRISDGIDHALRVLQYASDFTYTKDEENNLILIK